MWFIVIVAEGARSPVGRANTRGAARKARARLQVPGARVIVSRDVPLSMDAAMAVPLFHEQPAATWNTVAPMVGAMVAFIACYAAAIAAAVCWVGCT